MLAGPPQPAPLWGRSEQGCCGASCPCRRGVPARVTARCFRSCLDSAPPRLATGPGPALQDGLVLLE